MQSNKINEGELKNFFRLYNMKKIIDSGELYMFNAKLTKNEHDKIKQEFEKIANEQTTEKLEENPSKNLQSILNKDTENILTTRPDYIKTLTDLN